MRFDRTLLAASAIVLAALPSAVLHAQSSAPNPNLTLNGPVVPGVCYFSRDAVFANAKVGLAASARMKQLAAQAQSEIDAERKPIEADVQSYRSQQASLSADQRASREQSLAQRMQQVQADQQLRSRELQATNVKAMGMIMQDAAPIIVSVYNSKNCGVLIDRGIVYGGNMANDLTPGVVQQLDAKVTTISFNLETAPTGTQGATSP